MRVLMSRLTLASKNGMNKEITYIKYEQPNVAFNQVSALMPFECSFLPSFAFHVIYPAG